MAGIAEEAERRGLDPSQLEGRTRSMVRRGRKQPRPDAADGWLRRAESFLAEPRSEVTLLALAAALES